MDYLIYFATGILQDFLLTLNWRYVALNRPTPAAIYSFLTTVVTMLVLYNILTRLDAQRSIVAVIIYALGVGTGTLVGMKFKVGGKK